MEDAETGARTGSPQDEDDPSGTRRRSWLRWLLAALIVAAFAAVFALDLGRYLSWESLKAHRAELRGYVAEHRVRAMLVYSAVYVVATALSLPGAAVLTLAGGALFGRWLGTLIVSFASTAGATAAFLATRYLLRDFVQDRWRRRLEPINRAVEAHGASYLMTLRLVPLFPFFLVNIALGLTRMRVGKFWWVSQLGMLPGTFLYVNAGTELGRISSPTAILSPPVLGSLALLGVLPLAARKALTWWEGRRPSPGRPSTAAPAAEPPSPSSPA